MALNLRTFFPLDGASAVIFSLKFHCFVGQFRFKPLQLQEIDRFVFTVSLSCPGQTEMPGLNL